MNLVLIILFLIVVTLALVEDYLPQNIKVAAFILFGMAMFTTIVMKQPGCDPDYQVYEDLFYNNDDELVELATEPFFIHMSRAILAIGGGMGLLIFVNALLSLPIKMFVISKMSRCMFLSLVIYIPVYFELHDLIQMRASLAAAFLMLAVYLRYRKAYITCALFALLACTAHYSAFIALPIIAIGNIRQNAVVRGILAATLFIGYACYFAHIDVFSLIPSSMLGGKVDLYRSQGSADTVAMNLYTNAFFMIKFLLVLVMLIFYDYLAAKVKSFPFLINILYLSVMSMFIFSNVPVMAFRFSEFLGVFDSIAIPLIIYLISPRWVGKLCVIIIGTYMLLFNIIVSQYFT